MRQVAQLKGEVAGGMADQIGLCHRSQMRLQRRDPALFAEAPCDPADTVEGLQRLGRRIHVGGLAVIHEPHAADLGHGLAPVRQAREAAQRRLDLARGQSQCAAGGPGGTGILVVVRARQTRDAAQIDRGSLTPLAPFGQEPLAGKYRPAEAFQLLSRRNAYHAVIRRALAHPVGQIAPLGLVHADDGTVRAALREQPRLGGEVSPDAAMTAKMVGRQVGEHRDVGCQRAGQVGLVGRQFQHHDFAVLGGIEVERAAPDIAGHLRAAARGIEDMVDEGGRGGLAVRSGDGDDLGRLVHRVPVIGRPGPEEQADIVVDRNARCHRAGDQRMRCGVEMRDAGRRDEQRHSVPRRIAGEVGDGKALGDRLVARFGAVVPEQRLGTPGHKGTRGGEARTAEAEDGDALAGDTLNRDHFRCL